MVYSLFRQEYYSKTCNFWKEREKKILPGGLSWLTLNSYVLRFRHDNNNNNNNNAFIFRGRHIKCIRILTSLSYGPHWYKSYLRWKVTKLNYGVRGYKITPPECSIFWENVSVFSLCVIINLSFSRRHEIGMVLAFLTSSNSLLKLHIFGNYLQTNWPIEMIFTPKCLFR